MEDPDTFNPMRPAIPSRASGELKPLEPMFDEPPVKNPRITKRRKQMPRRKDKRLTRVKHKPARKVGKHPAIAAPYGKQAKNPNRPLERKNQLNAVLAYAASGVPSAEIHTFAAIAATLDKMTKPARQRVLTALAGVYA